MNYEALVRLVKNKSVVKVLLDTGNVSKWSVHQKWIVHDFIKIHSRILDITVESSSMTKGTVIDKSQWCSIVLQHDLKSESGRDMIKKLLEYYRKLISFIEDNGGWQTVQYYLTSRGMAAALTSMHSVDLDQYIDRVEQLSEDQQTAMNHIHEKRLTILAGPGAGKSTTLVHIVRELISKGKRVLVLMYNVAVKDQFVRRLKEIGVTNVLKHTEQKHLKKQGGRQVVVCTIHKYIYECLPYPVKQSSGGKVTFSSTNKKYIQHYEWDYCIVDEVQDLDRNLYDGAVNLVNSKHFIYAGDYRQNIAGDTEVFQRILSSSTHVHKIRDNHRSYPDIVSVLNTYSESNYSTDVHITQESMLLADPYPSLIIEQPNDIVNTIVDRLLEYNPGETFIIAPVSISKYDYKHLCKRVYNTLLLRDKNRYRHLHMYNPAEYKSDDMQMRIDKDYFITAKSAKGLERKQVILINANDIGVYTAGKGRRIEVESIISHIYVAMSRASHRLVLLLDEYKSKYLPSVNSSTTKEHPLNSVLKSQNVTIKDCNISTVPIAVPNKNISQLLDVTHTVTQLVPACNKIFEVEELCTFSPVRILNDHSHQLSDLIGIYVEACIADHYGVLKSKHICISPADNELLLGADEDTYVHIVKDTEHYAVDTIALEKLKRYQQYADEMSNHEDKKYAYVAMNMYMLLGQYDETVQNAIGDLFKDIDPDLSSVYSYIDSNGSTSDMRHHITHKYNIYADRSDCSPNYSTVLIGQTDFEHGEYLYEIKHSSGDEDKHCMQTVLYRMMTGLDSIVINTKKGKIYRVRLNPSFNTSTIERILRATAHVENAKRFPQGYCSYMRLIPNNTRYILSVDDEYRQTKTTTIYYERSIVVYDTVEKTVVDALSITHSQVRENTTISIVTGREDCHRFYNDILDEDKKMTATYHQFLSKYSPEDSIILHWAGSEGKNYDFTKVQSDHILKGLKWNCIDMRKIYEQYLYNVRSVSSPEEKYSSLDNAVKDLFGESMHLLYHRAYDDCIATVLIYIALTTY